MVKISVFVKRGNVESWEFLETLLEIVLTSKTIGKTEAEVKRGSYWIRKAQEHDQSYETLADH